MKQIFSFPLHASQLCSWVLIPALVSSPLLAQAPPPALPVPGASAAQSSNAPDNTTLQLRITGGAAFDARVSSTPAKGLVIAVTNASGAPVPDAAVTLRLPDSGPSGAFPDGSQAAVAYTDATGQAQLPAPHWGQTPGLVTMRVTATKGTSHAALLLNESLSVMPVSAAPTAPTADTPAIAPAPTSPAPSAPALRPAPAASVSVAQPGQPAPATASAHSIAQPLAQSGASSASVAPLAASKLEPTVSVSGASPESVHHNGKAKWIILAAVVAAGAGAGIALAGKGKSSSTPTSSISVGTPSVSVGSPH